MVNKCNAPCKIQRGGYCDLGMIHIEWVDGKPVCDDYESQSEQIHDKEQPGSENGGI